MLQKISELLTASNTLRTIARSCLSFLICAACCVRLVKTVHLRWSNDVLYSPLIRRPGIMTALVRTYCAISGNTSASGTCTPADRRVKNAWRIWGSLRLHMFLLQFLHPLSNRIRLWRRSGRQSDAVIQAAAILGLLNQRITDCCWHCYKLLATAVRILASLSIVVCSWKLSPITLSSS